MSGAFHCPLCGFMSRNHERSKYHQGVRTTVTTYDCGTELHIVFDGIRYTSETFKGEKCLASVEKMTSKSQFK